jgi:hypothetical protein
MGRRLQLQARLKAIPGVQSVYYQAPGAQAMVYPSIIYAKDRTFKLHANNSPYLLEKRYLLTAMDWDPDSPIFEALEMFPKCTFDRHYEKDQLNHQVFQLYF